MENANLKIIHSLPIWKGKININSLEGGMTNFNYLVKDLEKKVVVRLGKDIPEHFIQRSNEIISSKVANSLNISPNVVYSSEGVLVLEYIEGKVLTPDTIKTNIDEIIKIIRSTHELIPKKLNGIAFMFWVFHIIRNYSKYLSSNNSKYLSLQNDLLKDCDKLEKITSPHKIIFGHNDLLSGNFIYDGKKIWLIDWEYAGYNCALFDLGGLASNNNFDHKQEIYLLENYFQEKINSQLLNQFYGMKCASLLRETMWSMVSEIYSKINVDYSSYTQENLKKFNDSKKKLF
tara:strand:+ start:8480 stop:9346 length:867 start_codon:yes stop_codon:yes gene_type:complete